MIAEAARGGEVLFDGEAAVAGRKRRIRCLLDPDCYRLEIEGAGIFAVPRNGGAVAVLYGDLHADPALIALPRLLAFALRGTFCLHASAVERGGRAVALLGRSGAGKSMLANRPRGTRGRRLAPPHRRSPAGGARPGGR